MLKKWPTDCLQTGMCHPSASYTKSLIRVSFLTMTIIKLNVKIQLLLMCSYGLQRRLKTGPSALPLESQRPQWPFLRLNFNLNTLKDKSENIIVAPEPILEALKSLAKGTKAIMHEYVLVEAEAQDLLQANEILSRRRRAKRTRLQKREVITVEKGRQAIAQLGFDAQVAVESLRSGG